MKKFSDLNIFLQNELIKVTKNNPTQINPEFLYINIYNSRGTTKMLAEIFEVEEELIKEIKSETNNHS